MRDAFLLLFVQVLKITVITDVFVTLRRTGSAHDSVLGAAYPKRVNVQVAAVFYGTSFNWMASHA